MVSYTRLLLLVLLGLGTPLFLLFQGSMNLGQQIAAGTVLLALLSLFVFSGRKPLPSTLKSSVIEIEEDDEEPKKKNGKTMTGKKVDDVKVNMPEKKVGKKDLPQ